MLQILYLCDTHHVSGAVLNALFDIYVGCGERRVAPLQF